MRNRSKFRFIRAVLLLIIIVCLIQIGRAYYLSISHKNQQNELRSILRERQQDMELAQDETSLEESDRLEMFTYLYEINNNLIGWLTIEGMDIDYPVMQCEDDEYYLHHDFYGNTDKYGCLYVRGTADLDGTNFIIYGHNMKDGSMFGNLDKYRSSAFFRNHSRILFDTLYEERIYEVLAAFQSDLSEEDGVFKYYQFYQADTEKEFFNFYQNVKKISIYDTGITAEFGDTFLTLSTCDSHGEDSRFVVVAKRVE